MIRSRVPHHPAYGGEAFIRIHPLIRNLLRNITDDSGVPLELDQFLSKAATPFRGNLPLDDGAGAKLALVFRLSERVKDLDRVELIARRVMRFSREEGAYWLSRLVHFGKTGSQWAVTGLRIALAGEGSGPEIGSELETLKTSFRFKFVKFLLFLVCNLINSSRTP